MIRIIVDKQFDEDKHYIKAFGLSTDTKPTAGIVTGSEFTEANTGDKYLFAEGDTPAWTKVSAGYVDPDAP